MRMRYDENLDQTIIAVKNSRDEPEKDIVWLKGNILSFGKIQDNKKTMSEFVIPYNSKTGFSITMTSSEVSIQDDKKAYVLSDEFKDIKGEIIVEIDKFKHEGLMACRSYDHKIKGYKYSKYIFEKYGPFKPSRVEACLVETGAVYDIRSQDKQFKLEFDEKGLFQKGVRVLANGEEKNITSSEAHSIYSQANYGQLMEKHKIRLMPSIGFKHDLPSTGEVKPIPTEDWSHPMLLTSELVEKQRRLKRDYRKALCSTAVVILRVLADLVGVQNVNQFKSKKLDKANQIRKGQNSVINRKIQKQKDEKSY